MRLHALACPALRHSLPSGGHIDRLAGVETPALWRGMHAIRRSVLFEPGIFPFTYNEDHADDRAADNTPYLLELDGQPIGVARQDLQGTTGIVRIVGIVPEHERQGHGSELGRLIDEEALRPGITRLHVNVYVGAVGFYKKCGWEHEVWDEEELNRADGRAVQMTKVLNDL